MQEHLNSFIKFLSFLSPLRYLVLLLLINSCAGTSEIIGMSSRNLKPQEISFSGAFSMNPSIMPTNGIIQNLSTQTAERKYVKTNFPLNPILSGNVMYGVTNYYEAGLGTDLSLSGGYAIILNQKIGFSDLKNSNRFKKIGFSYYNKSSVSAGDLILAPDYNSSKKAHFEIGNYFITGIFLKNHEIIIAPHIDYNYIIPYIEEPFVIVNSEKLEFSNSESKNTQHNLPYLNYGLNVALKTNSDVFFETGVQYMDVKAPFYNLSNKKFHFTIGVSFLFKKKL